MSFSLFLGEKQNDFSQLFSPEESKRKKKHGRTNTASLEKWPPPFLFEYVSKFLDLHIHSGMARGTTKAI